MFKKIIKYFADKQLLKFDQTRKRERKIKTLNDSKYVGILWNPEDEGSQDAYESLRKIVHGKKIKTTGIAQIDSIREMEILTTNTKSGFLDKRNVTWLGRPKSNAGIHFIEEPFDILIDLSVNKTIALQYMLVHSKAIFKVGWKGEDPNYYDLTIDIAEKPQCKYLMEQMVYYLEKIN
jgi:hypothetical protein